MHKLDDRDYVMKAAKWCWDNDIYVVPRATNQVYAVKKRVGNKIKQINQQYAKIAIKAGGREKLGEHVYKQDEEMNRKIDELYVYYYERRWDNLGK